MSDLIGAPAAGGPETAIDTEAVNERRVWKTLRRRVGFWFSIVVLTVIVVIAIVPKPIAGLFGHGDPRACDLGDSLKGSAAGHPFGFDVQGCDVYANVIFGTRSSISVGIICILVALVIALIVGTLAGLYGGIIDSIFARLTDVFLGFPVLIGAIVLLTTAPSRNVTTVALILAVFSWSVMARLVRSSVRQVRDADFVQAARAMGFGTWRIITGYILPNSFGPVLAVATIAVGGTIVAESTLTFLGIGLQAPSISWGLQLAAAQESFQSAPHLLLYPGMFLFVTVLGLITLGDILRDVLDPRSLS